jgi:hypothetical protein
MNYSRPKIAQKTHIWPLINLENQLKRIPFEKKFIFNMLNLPNAPYPNT